MSQDPRFPADLKWHYYFVGYLDVLGQQREFDGIMGLPNTQEEKDQLVRALRETVGFLREFRAGFDRYFQGFDETTPVARSIPKDKRAVFEELREAKLWIKSFSDLTQLVAPLATSTNLCKGVNSIFRAMSSTGLMFLVSLANGHAIRGGFDVDAAVNWKDDELYGPALNRAYALESKAAQYPRILIGSGLIEFLQSLQAETAADVYTRHCKSIATCCLQMVARDVDGKPFLDYLGQGFREVFGANRSPEPSGALDELIGPAYNAAKKQQAMWQERGNTKLAFRYKLLLDYFEARATGVLVQGNWTLTKQHVDRRIGQVRDRDRGRITRCTIAYESRV